MEVRHDWDVAIDGAEPRRVAEEFEEIALAQGVPMGIVFKFQLALDEILTNVVSYAFAGRDAAQAVVRVNARFGAAGVSAVILDNGLPFNPLQDAATPDMELSAEDRQIGGLGIHLTRSFVHSVSYERTDGWNRLSLAQPLQAHTEEETA